MTMTQLFNQFDVGRCMDQTRAARAKSAPPRREASRGADLARADLARAARV